MYETTATAKLTSVDTSTLAALLAECTAELDRESFSAALRAAGFNPHALPWSAWRDVILREEENRRAADAAIDWQCEPSEDEDEDEDE